MSESKVRARSPRSFEDEYIQAVENKYGIDVNKSATRNMGAMINRTKPAKSQEPYVSGRSPEKVNGQLPQSTPGSMINGSMKQKEETLASKPTNGSIKSRARGKKKKRALESDSDDEIIFNNKRRKLNHSDISQRLRRSDFNSKDSVSDSAAFIDDPTVLNINYALSDGKGSNQGKSPVKDPNDLQRSIESLQNYKNLSLSEIYTSMIKETASDTSPFKGKSAFEISLLKGRQSMERRKSLEAAALRSSPRNNTNIPKPDYAERKRRQRTNSLPQTGVEKSRVRKLASRQKKSKPLRIRTSRTCKDTKTLSAVSPSSIENRFVEQNTRVRKKRKVSEGQSSTELTPNSPKLTDTVHGAGRSDGKTTSPARSGNFPYRMNGSSPKLKDMPTLLSLHSLSGIPQKLQGPPSSSCHTAPRSEYLSGTPPALPPPETSTTVAAALCGDSSGKMKSPRPDTLSVETSNVSPTNIAHKGSLGETAKSDAATKDGTEELSVCGGKTRSRRMTLEETVNMLRRSATDVCGRRLSESQTSVSKVHVSPTPSLSDGKRSRRSSRSSTPSMSPMKPDILTPSCTPSSTPCKSPRSSPSRANSKNQKLNKKRRHLFAKNDDVLARWHDGLFYSGKILKIDEKNSKCLLRYEDNSEFWSLFKDIHRVAKEEEMICCVCFGETSEAPDEIVLCDNCCQGYHQKCHSPNINSREIVDPDDEWFCRECVFLMSAKVGGAVKEGSVGEDLNKMKQSLPYALERLTWDMQHKNNIEQCYCYCGGPGIWYQKMLQCCRCKQWFHEACMQCTSYPLMFGDSFYIFVCTKCNYGNEFIRRVEVEWQDLLHIALFNLVMNLKKRFFNFETELVPWLEQNWKDLQIPQYDHLSEEERTVIYKETLRGNKTRFVCGEEQSKGSQLWGLRIRVPPPRIFITLPVSCQVSEDIMKKLKIKGRRSKVFIPMECKSPVNNLRHSPVHPMLRKRLEISSKVPLDQSTPTQGKVKTPIRKPHVNLPLLERLIPRQSSFSIQDHPFNTEIEQETLQEEMRHREEIWLKYQSMSGANTSQTEDPPILEKVEPISPSTSNSSTPPMPEINKKNRSKKSVQSKTDPKDYTPGNRKSRRVSLKSNAPPDITDILAAKSDISVKKVKASGDNYFCAFDKTGYGKGFFINGKREGPFGQLEYLVNWDM